MKETIITAVLALGLATGASAISLNEAELFVPNYDKNEYSNTWSGREFHGSYSTYDVNDQNKSYRQFTLVLELDWNELQKINLTTSPIKAAEMHQTANEKTGIGFKLNDEGNIVACAMNDGSAYFSSSALEDYVIDGTLTISLQQSKDGSELFALGESNGEMTLTSIGQEDGLRWAGKSNQYDSLWISDTVADSVLSILVYDYKLSTDDLLTVSVAIPEPTTATLSLLALAGLAARRRRK